MSTSQLKCVRFPRVRPLRMREHREVWSSCSRPLARIAPRSKIHPSTVARSGPERAKQTGQVRSVAKRARALRSGARQSQTQLWRAPARSAPSQRVAVFAWARSGPERASLKLNAFKFGALRSGARQSKTQLWRALARSAPSQRVAVFAWARSGPERASLKLNAFDFGALRSGARQDVVLRSALARAPAQAKHKFNAFDFDALRPGARQPAVWCRALARAPVRSAPSNK